MATSAAHGQSLATQAVGSTAHYGIGINLSQTAYLYSITKKTEVTATKAYLYTSGGVLIDSAVFTGDKAVFSPEPVLEANTQYYIAAGKDGAAYTAYRTTNPAAFPTIDGIVTFPDGFRGVAPWTWDYIGNILSLEYMQLTGGKGTKAIRTAYPYEEGLIARTTKQTGQRYLHPETGSNVLETDKTGID